MSKPRGILIIALSASLLLLLIKFLPQLEKSSRLADQHEYHSQQPDDDENPKQISNGFKHPSENLNQISNGFKHPSKNHYNGRLTFNCDGRVKGDNSKPTLVLGILSSNAHTERRDLQRKYLRIYESYPLNLIVCFLLDQPIPSLLIESERHKDMVFLNTSSLGWGGKMGEKLYKWLVFVTKTFPNSDLVGRMDDDVFLCLPEIFDRLRSVASPLLYYGWQPRHKLAYKLFVRPDRLSFVNLTKWVDEMFTVVGKSLRERIVQRKFCFDNNPVCNPLVQLVDSRHGSDSLGLWLKVYPDVDMVSDNKYLVTHNPSIQRFLRRDFCDKYILLHPVKLRKHMTQMYDYTWGNIRDSHS